METISIFVSAVTDEFKSYRDKTVEFLDRPGVRIETQERFMASGESTLVMLSDAIQQCHAVVHVLIGWFLGKSSESNRIDNIQITATQWAAKYKTIGGGVPSITLQLCLGGHSDLDRIKLLSNAQSWLYNHPNHSLRDEIISALLKHHRDRRGIESFVVGELLKSGWKLGANSVTRSLEIALEVTPLNHSLRDELEALNESAAFFRLPPLGRQ